VSSTRRWAYQPPLDGLRALAVAAVFAYHLDYAWATGGFLGVDTFFVLSGFLITSLLLNEYARDRTISLVSFWARRARRLLPALFVVLIAVAAYAAFLADSSTLDDLRSDMFATLFYGANWRFVSSGQSYFALFTDASPLRHAWSLAIEEQFYLVWPLIVFGCLRLAKGSRRVLAAVCIGGTILSALWMAWLYDSADLSRAYYGTDSHAQLLLVGALLAIVLSRWSPQRPGAVAASHAGGIFAIGFMFVSFALVDDNDAFMYRGGYLVFAIAVSLLIMSVIQPERTVLRAGLSLAPIVWVGRISYGIYLWHWPAIVILSPDRTGIDGVPLDLLRIAVTLALATASFYLLELPVREGRLFKGRVAQAFAPAAFVATGVVVMVATLGATPLPAYLQTGPTKIIAAGATGRGANADGANARAAADNRAPRMLLVGDSVATSLYPGLAEVATERNVSLSAAAFPGCGVLSGQPTLADGSALANGENCDREIEHLEVDAEAKVKPELVVWLSVWEVMDRIVDGTHYSLETPEGQVEYARLIDEAAGRFQRRGARLAILLPAVSTEGAFLPHYSHADQVERLGVLNQLLRDFAARNPRTTSIIDLNPIVCPGGPPCPVDVSGIELRPDGTHFEMDGARYVADRVMPLLQDSLASAQLDTTLRSQR
jgi:peptidoglycan/LPS O-acetylase OafA/YrhL